MPALLFGSISTIADTSEIQRQAFNDAFAEHGLDWSWSQDEYRDLLTGNGGAQRIADYAAQRGEDVDAAAVHDAKSRRFRELVGQGGVGARDGVAETVAAAQEAGVPVGLVTTTSRENVAALTAALAPTVELERFAFLLDVDDAESPKPAPDAYRVALDRLGVPADACVAIEDNVGGVESATAAGVTCVAFPNENTAGHDFGRAVRSVDRLDYEELSSLAPTAQA